VEAMQETTDRSMLRITVRHEDREYHRIISSN